MNRQSGTTWVPWTLALLLSGTATARGTEAAGFRAVSLEKRCESLVAHVSDFVRKELPPLTLGSIVCGEGNGLGGGRYNVDFDLEEKSGKKHALRLDVIEPELDAAPEVRLCDRETSPLPCTALGAVSLSSIEGEATTPASPMDGRLAAMHPRLPGLLRSATEYVTRSPGPKKIFGVPYDSFVKRLVDSQLVYPYREGGAVQPLRIRLVPQGPSVLRGRVTFDSPPPGSFLGCFRCPDLACLNKEMTYEFKDRFLMLNRTVTETDKEDPQTPYAVIYGGGWLIEGQEPSPSRGDPWSFVCGVSRYSLQQVTPAKGAK